MPNVEIKAKCRNLDQARSTALALGGSFLWKDLQVDTYFETRAGKLKLRQSELNGSELIPYLKSENNGVRRSDYANLPVKDPSRAVNLFTELLGKKAQVRKTREVYLIGNVRVHLDDVAELGTFLEFEAVFTDDTPHVQSAERGKLINLMQKFGIDETSVLQASYPDLLNC